MACRLVGSKLQGLIQSRRIAYLKNFNAILEHYRNYFNQTSTNVQQISIVDQASALLNESRTSFPAMSENVFRNKNYEENISYPSILQQLSNSVESDGDLIHHKPASLYSAECIAHECSSKLKREFQDLFPSRNLLQQNLTAITISQQTHNDMSVWNSNVEQEREELLQQFNSGAKEICSSLQTLGYWADFIDPASGLPFFGEHTNSSLYETDHRFTHFGFSLTDLGCCKVISHAIWGHHAYVGIIFTNAPVDHPLLLPLDQL